MVASAAVDSVAATSAALWFRLQHRRQHCGFGCSNFGSIVASVAACSAAVWLRLQHLRHHCDFDSNSFDNSRFEVHATAAEWTNSSAKASCCCFGRGEFCRSGFGCTEATTPPAWRRLPMLQYSRLFLQQQLWQQNLWYHDDFGKSDCKTRIGDETTAMVCMLKRSSNSRRWTKWICQKQIYWPDLLTKTYNIRSWPE